MHIVIFGLSITSSWGNGHATTYRALAKALTFLGHRVDFFERDVPWYAENRDLPAPPYADTVLYRSVDDAKMRFSESVRRADLVIVGSFVPDGIEIGRWVLSQASGATAFYDIDTPVTVDALRRGECEYLTPDLASTYDLYLSFTGGPILDVLRREFNAPCPRPLYCSVDPDLYFAEPVEERWDLGYLGTYAADRQVKLDRLLIEPARRQGDRRFAVFGPMYPRGIDWPHNVDRADHLPPDEHRAFYTRQRFTLNITRDAMTRSGWAPPVRMFEAAACGVPIVTDEWSGLEHFFAPGEEVAVARNAADVENILVGMSESGRKAMGRAARSRILGEHTGLHRAKELVTCVTEAAGAAPKANGERVEAQYA